MQHPARVKGLVNTYMTLTGNLGGMANNLWSLRNYLTTAEVPNLSALSYLPTPPIGQDRTQGQFLSGV